MFVVKCACGASEKNFKSDIGPFFVGECCEEAGYDHMGQKIESGMSEEETNKLTADLDALANELTLNTEEDKPADPVTEPSADPVTEPSADPVTEPSADPVTEPSADPVTEPSADPVTEPVPTKTEKSKKNKRN